MNDAEVIEYVGVTLETIKRLENENSALAKQAAELQEQLKSAKADKVRLEKVAGAKPSAFSFSSDKIESTVATLVTFNVLEKSAAEQIKQNLTSNPEYALDLMNAVVKHASSLDEGNGVTISSAKPQTDPHGWGECFKDKK